MRERLEKLSAAQVWLLSFVVSVAAAETLVAGIGIWRSGGVTYDDLWTGAAASLPVTGLLGIGLGFWLGRKQEREAKPQAEIPAAEAGGAAEQAEIAESPVVAPQAVPQAAPAPSETARHAEIRRAIRNLDVLPAMPLIAQRLLTLRLDTEEGEQELLVLVEQDAQISAKLIGLANSVALGTSRQIRTVREAAMLLGIRRVQSVATGIAIISLMSRIPTGELSIHDLWLHSIRVAFAMQGIARAMPREMRPQEEQILLAGMLHDIGYLVLAYLDPQTSDRLHNYLAAEPQRPAVEIERGLVDMCHDELGAELAHHWNLPQEIVAVLRYHHSPDDPGAAAGQPLVRMINIAEKLLPPMGIIEYTPPEIGIGEWAALGIDPVQAEAIRETVEEQAEQAMRLADSFA